MSSTSRGAPYPAAGASNNVPSDLQALAQWVNDRPGVATLSTTQRNALAAAELWTGREIWNTTTGRPERYSGTAWVDADARERARTFQRGNATSYDQYTGTANVLGGSWPSAPAGQYLLHTMVALISQSGNVPGSADFYVNGTGLDSVRLDVPTAFVATFTHVHLYAHPGGDLNFTMNHGAGSATITVMNGAAGKCIIQYLGPTA